MGSVFHKRCWKTGHEPYTGTHCRRCASERVAGRAVPANAADRGERELRHGEPAHGDQDRQGAHVQIGDRVRQFARAEIGIVRFFESDGALAVVTLERGAMLAERWPCETLAIVDRPEARRV